MGRIKDLAIEIEERENNGYMAYMLGISDEELQKLTFKTHTINSGFTKVVVFDVEMSPKVILSKVKNLENGNTVTYSLIE